MDIKPVTAAEVAQAEIDMDNEVPTVGRVVSAAYQPEDGHIMLLFTSGAKFSFPTQMAQGLQSDDPAALKEIQVNSGGLGLHWPKLDADLYVPSLLIGRFGSQKWMAQLLGSKGGQSRSDAKKLASARNGAKGGRPKKSVA
jgi:hypothetical protein